MTALPDSQMDTQNTDAVNFEFLLPYHNDLLQSTIIQKAISMKLEEEMQLIHIYECTRQNATIMVKGWVSCSSGEHYQLTTSKLRQTSEQTNGLADTLSQLTAVTDPPIAISNFDITATRASLSATKQGASNEVSSSSSPIDGGAVGNGVDIPPPAEDNTLGLRRESSGGLQYYDGDEDMDMHIVQPSEYSSQNPPSQGPPSNASEEPIMVGMADETNSTSDDVGGLDYNFMDEIESSSEFEDNIGGSKQSLSNNDTKNKPTDIEQKTDNTDENSIAESFTKVNSIDTDVNPQIKLLEVKQQLRDTRSQMSTLQSKYDDETTTLNNRINALKRNLTREHDQRKSMMHLSLEDEQKDKEWARKNEEKVSKLEELLNQQQSEHTQLMDDLEGKYQQQLKAMDKRMRQSMQLHQLEMTNVHEQHRTEKSHLEKSSKQFQAAVESSKEKDRLIRDLREQLERQAEEFEVIRQEYDVTIERMTEEHDKDLEEELAQHTQQAEYLIKTRRELEEEKEHLRKQNKSLNREMKRVREHGNDLETQMDSLKLEIHKEREQRQRERLVAQKQAQKSQRELISLKDVSSTQSDDSPEKSSPIPLNKKKTTRDVGNVKSVHRRRGSSITIHDDGEQSVIVVAKTIDEDTEMNSDSGLKLSPTHDTPMDNKVFSPSAAVVSEHQTTIIKSTTTHTQVNDSYSMQQITDLQKRVSDLTDTVDTLRSKLSEERVNSEKEINTLQDTIYRLKIEHDRLAEDFLNDKQRLHYALGRKETELAKLKESKNKKEKEFDEKVKQKDLALLTLEDDVKAKEQELQSLIEGLEYLDDRVRELQVYEQEVDDYNEEIDEFEKENAQLRDEKDKLETELDTMRNIVHRAETDIEVKDTKLHKHKDTISHLEDLITTLREKDDEFANLKEQEAALAQQERDLEQLREYGAMHNDDDDNDDDDEKPMMQSRESVGTDDEDESPPAPAPAADHATTSTHAEAGAAAAAVTIDTNDSSSTEELKMAENRVSTLSDKVNQLEQKLEQRNDELSQFKDTQNQIDSLNQQIHALGSEKEGIQTELSQSSTHIEQLNAELRRAEESKLELLRNFSLEMNRLRDLIRPNKRR